MRKDTVYFPHLTTVVALIVCSRFAAAQVALKPTGQNALPLRAKSLTANVLIKQSRFAETDLEIRFANDLDRRVEADFMYTVPDGAVVADFAYFYGTERVPARVAEKARAAAIYKAITDRQRDPALVEMVGKNTFRARIFPVEPNADLRVQIRYVQVLPVGVTGAATLALPLQTPKTVKWDAVSVTVRATDTAGANVQNNFGLPTANAGSGTTLTFSGTNYRTDKNLRVSLAAPKATPYLAATSGGGNGFFAATITAPVGGRLDAGSVQTSGVSVYSVQTHRLSGRDVLITGRYKGAGVARLSVRDAATGKRIESSPLTFTQTAEANSAATKLWAAAQIEQLSKRDTAANRKTGIALSKRFTLPSRWTSWIAIPVFERERMVREQAEKEMNTVAERLYDLRKSGRGESGEAKTLEARYYALCKPARRDNPKRTLQDYFSEREREDKANAEYQRKVALNEKAQKIYAPLYRLIREGKRDSPEANALRKRFDQVYAGESDTKRETRLKEALQDKAYSAIQQAEKQVMSAIAASGHDSAAAQKARQVYEARCAEVGRPADEIPLDAQYAIYNINDLLVQNVMNGKTGTVADTQLRQRRERLVKVASNGAANFLPWVFKDGLQQTATAWAQKKHGEYLYQTWDSEVPIRGKVTVEPGEVETLRTQVERLAKAAGVSPETAFKQAQEPWYREALRQKRIAVAKAYQSLPMRMPKTAKREADYLAGVRSEQGEIVSDVLKKHFYAANTPDGREAFARDRLARIAARTEADRLEADLKTPLSPPEVEAFQNRVAALRATENTLRARMGDPLIFVDAPHNAKSVTATLPNGEIVPLAWDDAAKRWQCRFDIPTYAAQGDYVVSVEVILADGSRTVKTFAYTVDTTAPTGTATVTPIAGGVRIEVLADADTVRAVVVCESGDTVMLTADPSRPGRFFGTVAKAAGAVSVVLTDRAHNRATLAVSVLEGGKP